MQPIHFQPNHYNPMMLKNRSLTSQFGQTEETGSDPTRRRAPEIEAVKTLFDEDAKAAAEAGNEKKAADIRNAKKRILGEGDSSPE